MSTPWEAASVHVGTSGWAYPAWKPVFYPEKLAQKKFLQFYATRLSAVEVNYSFRRTIGETTLTNWIAETPAGFVFCIKAHQSITHLRRLKNVETALPRFVDSVRPLAEAGKLGPVLFQLPPDFKADAALLESFLAQLPRTMASAFEFRHESWFSESVYAALRRYNAALVMAETEEFVVPDVSTAGFSYYRFRRSEYSPQERSEIAARLRRQASGGHQVFAFLKHEERPESALWAEEVLQAAHAEAAA